MESGQAPSLTTTAIIYAVAIALLVWRMARPQRMSVLRLWLMPLFLLVVTAFSIYAGMYASVMSGEMPPAAWQVAAVLAGGAALGLPLGFLRGRHSEVKPTERRGVMYVHSSPIIVIVWLAVFVGRQALRAALPHMGAGTSLATDGLLGFAVAALITSYYAIYQKYRAAVQQAAAA